MKRRLSLRGRMVVTAVVATAVVLAVLLVWASPTLERRARDDAFATLTAQAWLMARVAEEGSRAARRRTSSTARWTPRRARSTPASRSWLPTAACSPTPRSPAPTCARSRTTAAARR